jgi:hypothetical protein
MHIERFLMLTGLALAVCNTARAASPGDTEALEASNMVGVLEYCSAQKHASAENIANAKSILSHRTVLPLRVELDRPEHLGKDGTLLAAGEHHPLTEMGRQTHQTVAAMCEGLAMNADIAADMLKTPGH